MKKICDQPKSVMKHHLSYSKKSSFRCKKCHAYSSCKKELCKAKEI